MTVVVEKSNVSGGNVLCHGHIAQDGTQDLGYIIGGAHVAGASFERGDPQLLIRYTMGADDGKCWEIAVQVTHIGETGEFHVEDYNLWTIPGNSLTQFVLGASQLNGMEVRREAAGQRLREPGIAFKNDHGKAHRSS
ncbi:MAG: hypothetical protein WAL60_05270 [Candidatus Sulfotelmatobacter sp.]